ncbi:MAG: aminopeptidase P family protein [Anaerotruncus sp.]|nr:aminopeptidase P family protein [Anaerotruncus sp.]
MYQERISRVCKRMQEAGLSQLLITDHLSIYYLTGIDVLPFERFWALLMRVDNGPILFANKLFALGDTGFETVLYTDTDDISAMVAPYIAAGMLGVDKNIAARFLLPILDACEGTRPVLGSDCVDRVRACKDEAEKELMRRASQINDSCMEKLVAFLHDGVTERECAAYLDRCYAEYGCEGLAFDSIISFGANASDPHHTPDDTVIHEGDCIVIDIGCKKEHYCSDMTRTYFWKKADSAYVALYNLVREANERAEAMVRPGVRLCDIDAAARDHIAAAGYGEFFTHRLGHFIGMEDHEQGDVSSINTGLAQKDMVFSIEPGIYLPGKFGARIEDLVIVTEDGCELLNHVEKQIRILGNASNE